MFVAKGCRPAGTKTEPANRLSFTCAGSNVNCSVGARTGRVRSENWPCAYQDWGRRVDGARRMSARFEENFQKYGSVWELRNPCVFGTHSCHAQSATLNAT